jgi:alcohol dehydrogenase class IV
LGQILKNNFSEINKYLKTDTLFVTMTERSLNKTEIGRKLLKNLSNLNHITVTGLALSVDLLRRKLGDIKQKDFKRIVAIGGGTVIDAAKIFALSFSNPEINLDTFLDNPTKFSNKLDLICVPTTCGTGSEATTFAVVYRDNIKYSIVHESLLPKVIIHEIGFLKSLPTAVFGASYLDALAQGIESLWANGATKESKNYANDALIHLTWGINSIESRNEITNEILVTLQLGSYLAGKAINISKTTLAHAVSYPLTSYFNVPHGVGAFLFLTELVIMNFSEKTEDDFKLLFEIFRVKNVDELQNELRNIMKNAGFSLKLVDYGLKTDEDLLLIAKNSMSQGRSDNNPINFDIEEIYRILKNIFN